MEAPRAGESSLIFDAGFGRGMIARSFYYPEAEGGEREEIFKLWHYKKDWVAMILAVTTDRQVIAVREFRPAANQFLFTLPGGAPKAGLTPREVIQEELLEETGYRAEAFFLLGPATWVDPAALNLRSHLFLAQNCERVKEVEREPTELMETVLISVEEWYNKIFSHEILDQKAIALSCWAIPYLMTGSLRF